MTGSIAAVVFLTLIACLVLTVPIGFSLGIASLGYILYTKQLTFGFIAQNMVTGITTSLACFRSSIFR